MISAQDLHFIKQSNIAKFELKTTWASGIIYCEILSFGNLILPKDLHFIQKSNIAKFGLKTNWASGIIYCKILNSGSETQKNGTIFKKEMSYVFLLPQFPIVWQKSEVK